MAIKQLEPGSTICKRQCTIISELLHINYTVQLQNLQNLIVYDYTSISK